METVQPLVDDLLDWIGPQGRPYHEVMDAWRTSCPRLPVWERANELGFIETRRLDGAQHVSLTQAGLVRLRSIRASS